MTLSHWLSTIGTETSDDSHQLPPIEGRKGRHLSIQKTNLLPSLGPQVTTDQASARLYIAETGWSQLVFRVRRDSMVATSFSLFSQTHFDLSQRRVVIICLITIGLA